MNTLQEVLAVYEPVIGLEVHAQLKTKSKIFCGAPAHFDLDRPNHNITAYCFGLPGVLPVLNREALTMAIRAGLALDCSIRKTSVFARKHYFYPDLPKGYQISQYDEPLCERGFLEILSHDNTPKRVGITRIHMEEDAGKNTHVEGAPFSLVDYNRAGVPLIEIVSEPDLRSATEASRYLKALRSVLMTLDVCDGNMEEGSFRCDANVSIRRIGEKEFGTRCEIKNINSFRFVEQAIEFEIIRHARVLSEGGKIVQETRLFDNGKKVTRSMRSKEDAQDYRYFPDPDLPPVVVEQNFIDELRRNLPELPHAKQTRYQKELKLPEEHAQVFADEPAVAAFFEAAVAFHPENALPIANLIKGEVLRELKDDPAGIRNARLQPKDLAEIASLKESGKISSTQQKKIFSKLWNGEGTLENLLKEEGGQIEDQSLLINMIQEVIRENPKEMERYKAGNANVAQFFVGQVMKKSKGKANPNLLRELLAKELEKS